MIPSIHEICAGLDVHRLYPLGNFLLLLPILLNLLTCAAGTATYIHYY
ncbi:hypothetical protein Dtox_2969 [Desulfofarcimen acetoxidans DSM 771]|uniref:Uncharacterized protein n=1 Tax=Desulfofarcimen acetoxidans (strain ATCC 49208 / DSM 771 / KCTC 5769 / VKM B-1644 / 5575) TaxID=485916 RepID=C8W2N9_DESAS|nr:hypothetical protein Dtox_2969 [Desulfofarcimen acetoxidans DSM 771]